MSLELAFVHTKTINMMKRERKREREKEREGGRERQRGRERHRETERGRERDMLTSLRPTLHIDGERCTSFIL